jgi:hypothetical protein
MVKEALIPAGNSVLRQALVSLSRSAALLFA